ncbi:hypothetical protein ZWY2020_016321 [Hordeum vulgare]|nr:hypothetical protein ZWY2020_016321 [Hordeum vulgare]
MFRRMRSLVLTNCSVTTSISPVALQVLASSLRVLAFSDCLATLPVLSFSCTASLHPLSTVWLSRLVNLTELTITETPLTTGSPSEMVVVISHMDYLTCLIISNANLSGFVPHHWHCPNMMHIDMCGNRIVGAIPDTINNLGGFTHPNLSSNVLNGQILPYIGDLIWLTTVLNLGSSWLNGTIPLFLSETRGLKELNLENNDLDDAVKTQTVKVVYGSKKRHVKGSFYLCPNKNCKTLVKSSFF